MNDDEKRDIFWANKPSKECFGLTPVQAFALCRDVFSQMKQNAAVKKEKAEVAKTQGRRAAIEHTKRKNADE